MATLRCFTYSYFSVTRKLTQLQNNLKLFRSTPPPLFSSFSRQSSILTHSAAHTDVEVPSSKLDESPFSGLDEMMTGFIFGKNKATEVAHAVWKNVVRRGDVVVDATCGNGFDTLAMVRLIAGDDDDDDTRSRSGRVIAMDLQKDALESASSLLDQSLTAGQRGLVDLYAMCHTKMEDLVPSGAAVRLVAFNLGYLPGGNKKIKTESETTLVALEAAKRILARGGLISILAYVGHPGGREEFEKVGTFAAELPVDKWVCCKLEMLNRPSAPVLILLSRKK